jgi:hypothetical protein
MDKFWQASGQPVAIAFSRKYLPYLITCVADGPIGHAGATATCRMVWLGCQ